MSTEPQVHQRRYDIDALRIIAIFMLMFYHTAIVFQPTTTVLGWYPQSENALTTLWSLMQAPKIWRIPLLFVVSGMGFAFSMRRRGKLELFFERSARILLPAVFGVIFIVPLLFWIMVAGTDLPYNWFYTNLHLWFLFNIFIYVVIGIIPLHALRDVKVKGVYLITYCLPFFLALEAVLIPETEYSSFADSPHGLLVGGICFTYGFFMAKSQSWGYLATSAFAHLAVAVLLFLVRMLYWDNQAPMLLVSIEASCWLLAALGLGYRYINQPVTWLSHLSPAVYPMYIIHMIAMYAFCRLILPTNMPAALQFVIITVLTIATSYLGYRMLKPIPYVRKLFGMR